MTLTGALGSTSCCSWGTGVLERRLELRLTGCCHDVTRRTESGSAGTYPGLFQRLAGHSIRNSVLAGLAILAFESFFDELLGLGFDVVVKDLNKLSLGVLGRIVDVVKTEDSEELRDGEGRGIEVWFEVIALSDDLSGSHARHGGGTRGRRAGWGARSGEARRTEEDVVGVQGAARQPSHASLAINKHATSHVHHVASTQAP